jgi:hypothetical protein
MDNNTTFCVCAVSEPHQSFDMYSILWIFLGLLLESPFVINFCRNRTQTKVAPFFLFFLDVKIQKGRLCHC